MTDRGQLVLSRRALLRSAAGAVVVASLPFGLKASDLRPLLPADPIYLDAHTDTIFEGRWELEPCEELIVEAQAPADRELLFEAFGALGDIVDSQPFFVSRVYPGLVLWTVITGRAGVVVRCPGAVKVSAVVVGANFDLKWPGVSFRPMEPAEDEGDVVWEGFDEGD